MSLAKKTSVFEVGDWTQNCWVWGDLGIPVGHSAGVASSVIALSLILQQDSEKINITMHDLTYWNNNALEGYSVILGYVYLPDPIFLLNRFRI